MRLPLQQFHFMYCFTFTLYCTVSVARINDLSIYLYPLRLRHPTDNKDTNEDWTINLEPNGSETRMVPKIFVSARSLRDLNEVTPPGGRRSRKQ